MDKLEELTEYIRVRFWDILFRHEVIFLLAIEYTAETSGDVLLTVRQTDIGPGLAVPQHFGAIVKFQLENQSNKYKTQDTTAQHIYSNIDRDTPGIADVMQTWTNSDEAWMMFSPKLGLVYGRVTLTPSTVTILFWSSLISCVLMNTLSDLVQAA